MKKLICLMTILNIIMMTLSGSAFAFGSESAGTAGAQFLKLGAGAREGGMGEVGVGLTRDSNGIYWNPAGLNYIEKQGVSFMHMNWMDDINYDWAGYALRIKGYGVVGLGVQYMGYGKIDETNEVGAKVGNFEPSDMAVSMAYGREIGEVKVGGTVKYISSKIKRSAEAVALDLGVMYKVEETGLTVGGKVDNIGTALRYVSEDTVLPMSVKFGMGYEISKEWIAGCDVVIPNDNDAGMGIGTEYRYRFISGRIGYNTRTKDIGGLSGLSVGAGFEFGDISLDYSYQPYEYMGDAHRFSVTWNMTTGNDKKQ